MSIRYHAIGAAIVGIIVITGILARPACAMEPTLADGESVTIRVVPAQRTIVIHMETVETRKVECRGGKFPACAQAAVGVCRIVTGTQYRDEMSPMVQMHVMGHEFRHCTHPDEVHPEHGGIDLSRWIGGPPERTARVYR